MPDTPPSNELSDERLLETFNAHPWNRGPVEVAAALRAVIAADRALRPAADASKPAVAVEEMRRQFELLITEDGEWPNAAMKDAQGNYRLAFAASAWVTFQGAYQRGYEAATSACAAPSGWQLVPVKPTEAMCDTADDAIFDELGQPEGIEVGWSTAEACWDAMLKAAPAARAGKGE